MNVTMKWSVGKPLLLGLAGVGSTFLAQIAAVLYWINLLSRRVTKDLELRPAFLPGAFPG
jgi:hypothetical protein